VKASVKTALRRVCRSASRRPGTVETRAMGRTRYFHAYDLGADTFVFEKGVWGDLDARASVLIVDKRDLKPGTRGHVMTVTTGNHAVAALPLLGGSFWDLARISTARRGKVMTEAVLCANVTDGKLELSQRDVPCARLVDLDAWLMRTLGLGMGEVVFLDRNEQTLEHYRALGQEWRVKPLAWTDAEMSAALAASRKRISCSTRYYHGSRGVHFLSYSDFHRLGERAESDFEAFRAAVRELVSIFEGHVTSFTRQLKYHGHHEIEFFGLKRGLAMEWLVPKLELLMEGIVLRRLSPEAARAAFADIDTYYKAHLMRAELADDTSPGFVRTLYMYITGEIYSVMGEGTARAFDDRRTALPGATFVDGRPRYHAGCDARSEVLLSNIRLMMSKDEFVEYANVYELRADDADDTPIGQGATREIVYKTNRRPCVASLVEKRLSRPGRGYGSYVIARVEGFKALGVSLAQYRLLRRRASGRRRALDFYIRSRCEGEPLWDIPANYFQMAGEFGGAEAGEDPQVVEQLAFLMGDAAAQNMAMKKYDSSQKSCLYGIGKEIYAFGYDIKAGRMMPLSVATCSVRGVCGWPDTSFSEENLSAVARFYLGSYAAVLREFAAKHPVVDASTLGERFFAGFEHSTRAMEWAFTVQRDQFEGFAPHLPPSYGFPAKWRFALWSLERQMRRIDGLRKTFNELYMQSGASTAPAADNKMEEIDDEIIILD
jgi:hypothetical protein